MDHPPLVDAGKTRCEVCHPEMTEGDVVHAVAADCQTCHLFSSEDRKWTVTLVERSPVLCLGCHAELEAAAAGTLPFPHVPTTDDCLTCHRAHSSANAALLETSVPTLCFECHAVEELRGKHGVSVSRSNCTGCHPPHGADVQGMLVAGVQHEPYAGRSCDACHRRGLSTRAEGDSSKVCFACHDAESFKGRVVHEVVRSGECLSCHDPHSSPNPRLVRLEGESLCFSCHSDIAGKIRGRTVHPVVSGACDTCHVPHVAENRDLLVAAPPDLCSQCHELDEEALRRRHLGADLKGLDCRACHDAHGSSLEVMVADRSVHPPFGDGACATCHEDGSTSLVSDGDRTLCFACHGEIEAGVASAQHPHAGLDMAECRDCHSPHASRNRKLKRAPRADVCFACHDEVRAAAGEFQHGAITRVGCESCHEAHGGSWANMIRESADELCLECHGAARKPLPEGEAAGKDERFEIPERYASRTPTFDLRGGIGHPLPGHRALGAVTEAELVSLHSRVSFTGELHCVTCHDPHKGSVRELFVDGRSEVCSSCHDV